MIFSIRQGVVDFFADDPPSAWLAVGSAAALLVIASMTLISSATLYAMTEHQERVRTAVGLVQQLKEASQKLALAAAVAGDHRFADGNEADTALLHDSFEHWTDVREKLRLDAEIVIGGDDVYVVAALFPEACLRLFSEPPHALDSRLRIFQEQVQALVQGDFRSEAEQSAIQADIIRTASGALQNAFDLLIELAGREGAADFERQEIVQEISLWTIMVTLALEGFFLFRPLIQMARAHSRQLFELATTDPLTGLFNRRAFMEMVMAEISRTRRYQRPLTIAMVDIDKFKRINDTYGHDVGDRAICHLVSLIVAARRSEDIPGRLGGEEFAILLPETDVAGAEIMAERLREKVEASPLHLADGPTAQGKTVAFTISIGISPVDPNAKSIETALKRADEALYSAKSAGRNRVVCHPGVQAPLDIKTRSSDIEM